MVTVSSFAMNSEPRYNVYLKALTFELDKPLEVLPFPSSLLRLSEASSLSEVVCPRHNAQSGTDYFPMFH